MLDIASGSPSTDPIAREAADVHAYDTLRRRLRRLDPQAAQRLLLPESPLNAQMGTRDIPGAPAPEVAKASYTRAALKAAHDRRRALRGGVPGLLAALTR